MPASQIELKDKQGRTVSTRLSLIAFWNLFSDLGGRSPITPCWEIKTTSEIHQKRAAPWFSRTTANVIWELCKLSRTLVSGGSWPSPNSARIYSHSTPPGFIAAEGGSGECKPCIFGAERGTWPWILFSWSLLMKQHDLSSTQKLSSYLQVATPCCPFFMASSQIAAPQSIESSREFELIAISWRSCFSLEYLAREVGLKVMSWKVTSVDLQISPMVLSC
jgi:hypothetical protein